MASTESATLFLVTSVVLILTTTQAVDQVAVARGVADDMKADIDLHIMKHDNYGKGFIKTCKISPDAYIQIALQLAHYKVNSSYKFHELLYVYVRVQYSSTFSYNVESVIYKPRYSAESR